jgi:hypothetical protein
MIITAGFRAKTGRAIAVVLAEPMRFIWRGEIRLYDPDMPETGQPYHEVMELPWSESIVKVEKFVKRIEAVATRALAAMIKEHGIRAIGVVGSPDKNLAKIGNEHIRAHAAEGVLFRRVIEVAAANHNLRCQSFSDRELRETPPAIAALRAQAGPPWRADERLAATAAWMAMGPR